MATVNEARNETQILFTDEQREYIISQFPESVRVHLYNVKNPLNETEVLIELFRSEGIRICCVETVDEFGVIELTPYYHTKDIAAKIGYSAQNVNQLNARNGISLVKLNELLLLINQGVKIIKINWKHTNSNAWFINEDSLKIILIDVKRDESKIEQDDMPYVFKQWILQQSKVFKKLIQHVLRIKLQLDSAQIKAELEDMRMQNQLRLQEQEQLHIDNTNRIMQRLDEASKLYLDRTAIRGFIYIATSPDKQAKAMYKIGKTSTIPEIREIQHRCHDAHAHIEYSIEVDDIDLTEHIIHAVFSNVRTYSNLEFFHFTSLNRCIELVEKWVYSIQKLTKISRDDSSELRLMYANGIIQRGIEDELIRIPIEKRRSRSKSPQQKRDNVDDFIQYLDKTKQYKLSEICKEYDNYNIIHPDGKIGKETLRCRLQKYKNADTKTYTII